MAKVFANRNHREFACFLGVFQPSTDPAPTQNGPSTDPERTQARSRNGPRGKPGGEQDDDLLRALVLSLCGIFLVLCVLDLAFARGFSAANPRAWHKMSRFVAVCRGFALYFLFGGDSAASSGLRSRSPSPSGRGRAPARRPLATLHFPFTAIHFHNGHYSRFLACVNTCQETSAHFRRKYVRRNGLRSWEAVCFGAANAWPRDGLLVASP